MENASLNDTQESESNLDTSRSSTNDETTKSRAPYALHINGDDKENSAGDNKTTTPNRENTNSQNKGAIKKVQTPTETTAPHGLRAPYAQPILDASKLLNGGDCRKSSVEERLASARERRVQQQKQIEPSSKPEEDGLELGLMMRKEREDQAHAKWVQSQEDRRKKIEENRVKDDAHRREVELRKKQQLDDDRKKAEAKIARTEQVYEVKLRQKRNSSSDRGAKRWSWGDGDAADSKISGSMTNLVSPSNSKPRIVDDRFSKSPLLVNTTHLTFASGLRSYDSSPSTGSMRGSSAGRPVTAGITEVCSISPRLLAPTRASLARSRTAINELDDTASQSSNASSTHTGPMRSRSKDRKSKEKHPARSDTGSTSSSPRVEGVKSTPPVRKPTPDRKSTPTGTRGASPMLGTRRRPPSPAKTNSTPGGSEMKRADSKSDVNKTQKRGTSPQARPYRPPSPAKPRRAATPDSTTSTPPRSSTGAAKRPGSPSPAPAAKGVTPKTNVQTDSQRTASTPPNIRPSLRTGATQLKGKSSPAATKTSTSKQAKPSTPKSKPETPKASEKAPKLDKKELEKDKKEAKNAEEQKKLEVPEDTNSKDERNRYSVGTDIPKSLSNTSQAVSDIPLSEENPPDHPKPVLDTTPLPTNIEEPQQVTPTPNTPLITPIKEKTTPDNVSNEDKAPYVQDSGIGDSLVSNEPQHVAKVIPKAAGDASEDLVTPQKPEGLHGEMDAPLEDADNELLIIEDHELAAKTGDSPGEEGPRPENQDSLDYFVTVNPEDPDASSPRDSLEEEVPEQQEEPENSLRSELESSMEYPPAEEFSLQSELNGRADAPENKDSLDENPTQENQVESTEAEADPSSSEEEENSVIEVVKSTASDEPVHTQQETKVDEEAEVVTCNITTAAGEVTEIEKDVVKEEEPVSIPGLEIEAKDVAEEMDVSAEGKNKEPASQKQDESAEVEAQEPAVKEDDASREKEVSSTTSSESAPAPERKPRKNLETEEDKEAYRRAIAEKRRELKEKKEQEERERQERISLAKVEQAKREEEARRMFEEAAAAAELQKKQEEEKKRLQKEAEEKRIQMEKQQEEEAIAKKREAAEKVKKEREAQKQKQEDERTARKKRLEMIMRRTRQPDADAKPASREPSTSPTGTPSPQNTPVSMSPALGQSPQTQSPVGGRSPLISLTPERAVSPATTENSIKRNDNYLNIEVGTTPNEAGFADNNNTQRESEENRKNRMQTQNQQDLFSNPALNEPHDSGVELIQIDNADVLTGNVEKPTPFEAFTTTGVSNGIKHDVDNHNKSTNNMDPFSIFGEINNGTDGDHQTNATFNGAENLINMNADIISPKVSTEPLVPTGI